MKSILYIGLVLVIASCGLTHHSSKVKSSNFDLTKATETFSDSLLNKTKVDTLLVFEKGCSGCVKGSVKVTYIYWEVKGIRKIKKITNKGYSYETTTKYDLLDYYFANEKDIRSQILQSPKYIIDHYGFTGITLYLDNDKFNLEIKENYIAINQDKAVINWIYRIESNLFKIENFY